MKYMLLITSTDGGAECSTSFEDWQVFDKAVQDAGIMVSAHSLADFTTATTVRVDDAGEPTITDGPFAESREVLGGYYVIDVPDLDAALHWATRCPGARGSGAVVVRPIADF
ncbi:YciI family protein [Melissospora conviva]|uniref:YciI family protein n=1 Tax=Melissospora conviva TaxID=3388432 RepID=UPI003C24C79E